MSTEYTSAGNKKKTEERTTNNEIKHKMIKKVSPRNMQGLLDFKLERRRGAGVKDRNAALGV